MNKLCPTRVKKTSFIEYKVQLDCIQYIYYFSRTFYNSVIKCFVVWIIKISLEGRLHYDKD